MTHDVEPTLADAESPDDPSAAPRRGSSISRYLLIDRIGAGAMGVVWSAYDPKLDRKIAIKLLRPRRGRDANEEARVRLLREAQAMARLNHPNVIFVHDVGESHGRVFVAMEFVEGRTLDAWLRAEPREAAAVLALFVQAGRGLAAAHAAGLVHRDFKPDNVLVGTDGRVRVTDFGLARSLADEATTPVEPRPPSVSSDAKLEHTATLAGTPAFMAPEQFDSGHADARSDQFSYCVSLWSALFRERPFAGESLAELAPAVMAGRVRPPPSNNHVPAFVQSALRRGLSVNPSARWPTLDELLAALERDPSSGRRRWLVAGGLAAGLAALVTVPLAFDRHDDEARRAACEAGEDSPVAMWTPERAHALELAFVAGGPAAAASWTATRPWLDGYADRLAALHRDNCLARDVEGTRSAAEAEAVAACLADAGASFEALVEVLGEGRDSLVEHAAPAAAGLPLLDECSDVRHQLARVRPGDHGDRIAVMRLLHRARALRITVAFGEAEHVLDDAEQAAEQHEDSPLRARIDLERAGLLLDRGEPVAARERAELAFRRSAVFGDTPVMFEASRIVATAWLSVGEIERAASWTDTAAELLRSADLDASLQAAQLDALRSRVANTSGNYGESEALARAAIQRIEALLGPDHPELLTGLSQLGVALHEQGRHAELQRVHERHLALLSRAYGPDSPTLLTAYVNIGASLQIAGRTDEARAYYERGIAIAAPGRGLDHVAVNAITNLALLTFDSGELEPARVQFQRAVAIIEAHGGPESPTLLRPLVNLGTIASRQGHHERALAYFARCVALLERIQTAAHDPREVWIRASHADAYLRKGEPDLAEPLYRRALDVAVALDGDEAKLVRLQIGLAIVALERGDLAQAEAELARADATIEREPTRRWALDFAHARLSWARGDHEDARRRLAAVRAAQLAQPDTAYSVADIDAWLQAHDATR